MLKIRDIPLVSKQQRSVPVPPLLNFAHSRVIPLVCRGAHSDRTVIQITEVYNTRITVRVFTHIPDAIYLYIRDSNWAGSCRANARVTR